LWSRLDAIVAIANTAITVTCTVKPLAPLGCVASSASVA
jgi:hypothetical protein